MNLYKGCEIKMALILVVDDSKDDREIVKEFLRSHSHDSHSASSGEEAIELIQNKKFDLVISDYHMPMGDGLWLLQKLKEIADAPRCIVVTGEFKIAPEYFLAQGASGFCFKPII